MECYHQMRPLVAQLVVLVQIVLDEIDSLVVVLIVQVYNRPSLDYDHLTFVSYHLGFQWCNDLGRCYLAICGFFKRPST